MHNTFHSRVLAHASITLLLILAGCAARSQDAAVDARTPTQPTAQSAAPAAKEVKRFLSDDSVQACVEAFLRHYKTGDALVSIPPAANDFERMIVNHIAQGSSPVLTDAAKTDAKTDEAETLWDFRRALGPAFSPAKCGEIKTFIDVAFMDAKRVNSAVKKRFNRPRPSEADPEHPKSNPSFPSGHATTAGLRYKLLTAVTQATPDQEIELFKQAWFMCYERLIVGVHYPSDIAAGFELGEMVADELLKQAMEKSDSDVGRAFKKAKEQWTSLR